MMYTEYVYDLKGLKHMEHKPIQLFNTFDINYEESITCLSATDICMTIYYNH